MKTIIRNEIFVGAANRNSLIDLIVPDNYNGKIILFIHGYMGFKDWGCWHLVEDFFTAQGFGFSKYNVSHNGTTPEHPREFEDLEAFSVNSYSKEVEDLEKAIDWIGQKMDEPLKLILIGHSRGGGISLLFSKHPGIHKIISWAAISDIGRRFPLGDELMEWEKNKVRYVLNSRTSQQMPHNYSQYEDYIDNKNRLNIQNYCEQSETPTLVIHGDKDTSVNISEGFEIAKWLKQNLLIIEGANHGFGSAEPYSSDSMPDDLLKICKLTSEFILK